MASEELAAVHELLRGLDLDALTIAERRAATESVAAQPPPGTTVEPVDAGGVPAEWVIAAGVDSVRVLLYLHGGAYQIGSPATLRHMIALISAAGPACLRHPVGEGAGDGGGAAGDAQPFVDVLQVGAHG
jgi:acetyl esterase/lipase